MKYCKFAQLPADEKMKAISLYSEDIRADYIKGVFKNINGFFVPCRRQFFVKKEYKKFFNGFDMEIFKYNKNFIVIKNIYKDIELLINI